MLLGRSYQAMREAFEQVSRRLPLTIKELHPDNGVITFFRTIFPAKQKEIRVEDEKEACPARLCPSKAGKSAPVSRLFSRTNVCSQLSEWYKRSMSKHFFAENAAEGV